MPRPRYRRPVRELTLMQHSDLVIGMPDWQLPRYPFPRSGFASLEDLKRAWFEYRDELLAEREAEGRPKPWAYYQFEVTNGR